MSEYPWNKKNTTFTWLSSLYKLFRIILQLYLIFLVREPWYLIWTISNKMVYASLNVMPQNFSCIVIYGVFVFRPFFSHYLYIYLCMNPHIWPLPLRLFLSLFLMNKMFPQIHNPIFNFNLYFLFCLLLFTFTINCFDLFYHIVIV